MLGLSYLTAAVFRKTADTVSNDVIYVALRPVRLCARVRVCAADYACVFICMISCHVCVCVRVRVGYTRALQCVRVCVRDSGVVLPVLSRVRVSVYVYAHVLKRV